MKLESMYMLREEANEKELLIASYYIELPSKSDPYEKAKTFAVGQTIGTWVPVPGITQEMQAVHMGKVIQIFDLPPADLSSQVNEDEKNGYIFQIGYPVRNFGPDLPMMLTTLLGNDASTSAQAKLVDIQMPGQLLKGFQGPKYGIQGIREYAGAAKRPLLLNMIKPCTGFSPSSGARIFYETALGGVDFIKDDELLGNPDYCPLLERVKAYNEASRAAYEITGKETIYIANVTGPAGTILSRARQAVEEGAKMLMINFSAVGYSVFQMVAEGVDVPVMGHYAGTGPYYEGSLTGISSPLSVGRFPRMAGADIVMINTPYGGYPLKSQKYLRTFHELSLPLGDMKPSLTSVGGGVRPGLVEKFIRDLGTDIMLAPGGAVQGHPMGAAAGVRAMYQAIDAVMNHIPLSEAAKEQEELNRAIALWG